MRKVVVVVCASLLLLGVMTGSALSQEPPPPHDHFLMVPGTGIKVQVGPRRCDLGSSLQQAFLNFHLNVHVGQPMQTGGLTISPDFCP